MARPGQSEAQEREERADEIRRKMMQLKNAGKLNKSAAAGGEDSVMLEAEAFFNKESPLRKFERETQARKEKEALRKAQEEGEDEKDEGVADNNVD